ncbi:uncharacterized protein LOC130635488 [Hydractinia symbiolongicarpus]|uniref:uncharacterized protein LOC130635488 n=1 Tax=Hydractinia symbiolongicarpus TaxID=13093 RepID=UPI00254EA13D|nr:uncharacterized protein LOC130635488 [Hydractinia symbiolongicarpus]
MTSRFTDDENRQFSERFGSWEDEYFGRTIDPCLNSASSRSCCEELLNMVEILELQYVDFEGIGPDSDHKSYDDIIEHVKARSVLRTGGVELGYYGTPIIEARVYAVATGPYEIWTYMDIDDVEEYDDEEEEEEEDEEEEEYDDEEYDDEEEEEEEEEEEYDGEKRTTRTRALIDRDFFSDDDDDLEDEDKCIICLSKRKSATFVHGRMGHCCCCLSCAYKLEKGEDNCPVCRAPIDFVIRQY